MVCVLDDGLRFNLRTAVQICAAQLPAGARHRGACSSRADVDARESLSGSSIWIFGSRTYLTCRKSPASYTTEPALSAAFVRGKYTDSLAETCPDLRYCPGCLERGFQSALFQLAFVPRCPIHHSTLKQQCGHCAGTVPYRLSSSLLRKPFTCPHCGGYFAPALREGRRHDLRMSSESHSALERVTDIACTKSRLGSAQQLGQHFSFFGRGRWVLSGPSMQRSKAVYYEFLDAILHYIVSGLRNSSANHIITSDVHAIIPAIQIVRGNDLPRPRIQWWRFPRAPSRRLLLGSGCGRVPIGVKKLRKSAPPSPGPVDPTARNIGAERPAADNGLGALRSHGWDGKLQAIYPVYQAIRRHIFRRVLSAHRS